MTFTVQFTVMPPWPFTVALAFDTVKISPVVYPWFFLTLHHDFTMTTDQLHGFVSKPEATRIIGRDGRTVTGCDLPPFN